MKEKFTENWSFTDFLKFVSPSIFTMLIIALYTVVDGIFVSRGVGSDALAAVNIVIPFLSIGFSINIMIAVGGSVITGIKLGEGKKKEANEKFTFTIVIATGLTLILSILAFLNFEKLIVLFSATDRLLPYCKDYGITLLLFAVPYMLEVVLEYFIRTDGNANFALLVNVIGGNINFVLDYIFIVVLKMGIIGAAYGTAIGVTVAFILDLFYFLSPKSTLKFRKFGFDWKFLKVIIINGSSEMVSELSASLVTILFNTIMIKSLGEAGVAALSMLLYLNYFIISVNFGLAIGIQPVISFNHGAKNIKKIKDCLIKSLLFVVILSLVTFFLGEFFSESLIKIFGSVDKDVREIAINGMKLFSFSFLLSGFNILGSAFFTSVNEGRISAVISFLRALVFVIIGVIVLPKLFGFNGFWLSIPFAELMGAMLTLYFFVKKRELYTTRKKRTRKTKNYNHIAAVR